MLQQARPDDFVIATGVNNSLEEFVATAFELLDLDWHDYVIRDEHLVRPTDIAANKGDAGKAMKVLGWTPEYYMRDVVKFMVEAELKIA